MKIRALFWSGLAFLLSAASCTTPRVASPAGNLDRFEFAQPQMGVAFRIILYTADSRAADAAAQAAFQRIRQLNDIMSDYDYDSELSQLSRSSEEQAHVRVSPDLWLILNRAQVLARRTDGAFDVTVGPCVQLWRKARRVQQLPEASLLAETRKLVGYQHMRLFPGDHSVQLLVSGMRLDLGGMAKGYAADEALAVLRSRGITRALIAADGDIRAGDPPPGKPGWRVAIVSPDIPGESKNQLVLLKNAGISTSGDLSQRLEIGGQRYSHIVDPRTGVGLTDHSLVTIIARDTTTSDSLATAVSVVGPERGLKLIETTAGTAARIFRQPQDRLERYESKKFQGYVIRE